MTERDESSKNAVELQATAELTSVGNLRVRTKATLSTFHVRSAARFARLAHNIEVTHAGMAWSDVQEEFEEHRAYVIGSILASVGFLESSVNEFFCDARDNSPVLTSTLGNETCRIIGVCWHTVMEDGRRPDTLSKYQTALQLANRDRFRRGAEPLQSVNQVIRLRNDLVHFKPAFSDARDDNNHYTKQIRDKFEPNQLFPDSPGNPYFPDKCLGAGCAAWAFESVLTFANEFYSRIGIESRHQLFEDKLRLDSA